MDGWIKNKHRVCTLLCFVVWICTSWLYPCASRLLSTNLFYPWASGLLQWHWGNHRVNPLCPMKYTFLSALFCDDILIDSCHIFTHILQGCFTGTGAILWLPSASEAILKDMGKSHLYQTKMNTTKYEPCKYFLEYTLECTFKILY